MAGREARGLMPGLSGTGRLGDDLWLLAHDERSGRPHLQPRALGAGLAGGLLAELLLAGCIGVASGGIGVNGRIPPGDALAQSVLAQIAGEPGQPPVRDWLLFLGRTAARQVAERLATDGYLAWTAGRAWQRGRWVPVDADSAFAPLVRVKATLTTSGPLAAQYVALGALATACGLDRQLALYLPPGARERLHDAATHLNPGVRELVAATKTVVDSALLAHRI
jgi:Golgi phosphoprotein 3 (GPP34)